MRFGPNPSRPYDANCESATRCARGAGPTGNEPPRTVTSGIGTGTGGTYPGGGVYTAGGAGRGQPSLWTKVDPPEITSRKRVGAGYEPSGQVSAVALCDGIARSSLGLALGAAARGSALHDTRSRTNASVARRIAKSMPICGRAVIRVSARYVVLASTSCVR